MIAGAILIAHPHYSGKSVAMGLWDSLQCLNSREQTATDISDTKSLRLLCRVKEEILTRIELSRCKKFRDALEVTDQDRKKLPFNVLTKVAGQVLNTDND
jgi:hypothetical protein